ncbi:hypothetical protein DXZ20_24285 [Leptolyngbyaceae cyanobacterium CCMR0081]|uniref:Uncharacterized protein n=1 Tax=Adonisia turfae CCMR0081 TaxID=2292702 RepID=A0A6M0RSE4_9CYAN|nr:hypothetical protein [Adonisia turfae CCMR0081]
MAYFSDLSPSFIWLDESSSTEFLSIERLSIRRYSESEVFWSWPQERQGETLEFISDLSIGEATLYQVSYAGSESLTSDEAYVFEVYENADSNDPDITLPFKVIDEKSQQQIKDDLLSMGLTPTGGISDQLIHQRIKYFLSHEYSNNKLDDISEKYSSADYDFKDVLIYDAISEVFNLAVSSERAPYLNVLQAFCDPEE